MEPCVKWSFALNRSALLPHTMQRACQLAMAAPRGPVFVSVPFEHLMETMVAEPAGGRRAAAAGGGRAGGDRRDRASARAMRSTR